MADFGTLLAAAREARLAGDIERAARLYREAGGVAATPMDLAFCLRHIGDLQHELGNREAAREALEQAEALYRADGSDPLGLANTMRLLALIEGTRDRWLEARALYEDAARSSGLDLSAALAECDRASVR